MDSFEPLPAVGVKAFSRKSPRLLVGVIYIEKLLILIRRHEKDIVHMLGHLTELFLAFPQLLLSLGQQGGGDFDPVLEQADFVIALWRRDKRQMLGETPGIFPHPLDAADDTIRQQEDSQPARAQSDRDDDSDLAILDV